MDKIDDIDLLSPLVWAYIGDAIYEIEVREFLVRNTKGKVHDLHILSSMIVNAKSQCRILKEITDKLTCKEKDILRRARNTKNHHIPKNTTLEEYAMSTALEAIIGYHHLKGNTQRVKELIDMILDDIDIDELRNI